MEDKTEENKNNSEGMPTAETSVVSSGGSSPGSGPEESPESTSTPPPPPRPAPPKKGSIGKKLSGLTAHLNIYFLAFVLIVIISGVVVFVSMQKSKKGAVTTIDTQPLTQEALSQLKDSEAKVGDPKQTLTIESNAIFTGKVLVRDSLDVAGGIKVGSALTLPGISVSGTSTFDQIQGNKLSISGDTVLQGQVNIQKSLTVGAGATFGGPISTPQLTAQTLQLTNDLQITRHIDAGGGTPGKSDGTALGNGGTASLGGTDTAGTVTINTGSSPVAGCFVTVTFTQKFSGTPHIALTPIGSGAAGLNYYANRNSNSNSFSICTTTPAPAGQSFSFDYIVID